MDSYSFHDVVLGAIEDAYPTETRPAQNAYLRDLYAMAPDGDASPALASASVDAGTCIQRVRAACPHLSDPEAEAVGMQQFCEEFSERLTEEALCTFRAARNCGV